MTPQEIAALVSSIRELDAKATPGPWKWEHSRDEIEDCDTLLLDEDHCVLQSGSVANEAYFESASPEDAALIAAYRILAVQAADALEAEHKRAEALAKAIEENSSPIASHAHPKLIRALKAYRRANEGG